MRKMSICVMADDDDDDDVVVVVNVPRSLSLCS